MTSKYLMINVLLSLQAESNVSGPTKAERGGLEHGTASK